MALIQHSRNSSEARQIIVIAVTVACHQTVMLATTIAVILYGYDVNAEAQLLLPIAQHIRRQKAKAAWLTWQCSLISIIYGYRGHDIRGQGSCALCPQAGTQQPPLPGKPLVPKLSLLSELLPLQHFQFRSMLYWDDAGQHSSSNNLLHHSCRTLCKHIALSPAATGLAHSRPSHTRINKISPAWFQQALQPRTDEA